MVNIHYFHDVYPGEGKNIEAQHGCGGHKHEKESVIPLHKKKKQNSVRPMKDDNISNKDNRDKN